MIEIKITELHEDDSEESNARQQMKNLSKNCFGFFAADYTKQLTDLNILFPVAQFFNPVSNTTSETIHTN